MSSRSINIALPGLQDWAREKLLKSLTAVEEKLEGDLLERVQEVVSILKKQPSASTPNMALISGPMGSSAGERISEAGPSSGGSSEEPVSQSPMKMWGKVLNQTYVISHEVKNNSKDVSLVKEFEKIDSFINTLQLFPEILHNRELTHRVRLVLLIRNVQYIQKRIDRLPKRSCDEYPTKVKNVFKLWKELNTQLDLFVKEVDSAFNEELECLHKSKEEISSNYAQFFKAAIK